MIRRALRQSALALLPGALVLTATSIVLLVPSARETARPLVPVSLVVVPAVGILLGLRFRNVRVVVALLVLTLADLALTRWLAGGTAHAAVALLVPLDLAALAWMREGGAQWPRLKAWMLVIGVEAVAVAVLASQPAAEGARSVWRGLLDGARVPWSGSGRPVAAAFVIGFALVLVRFARCPRATESGMVWAVVAAFVALGLAQDALTTTLYLVAGSLVLIVGLVETSYAMAYRDGLTGLPSRRALDDLLASLGARYAIGMVDVDHFKRFNDAYGHEAGDQLLRKVAAALGSVEGGGRAFRYGGEEFAVVFPGLAAERAVPHLERLRAAVAATSFAVRATDRPRKKPARAQPAAATRTVAVTVSIGVADSDHAGPTAGDVVKAADEALYRAKRAGRNRIAT